MGVSTEVVVMTQGVCVAASVAVDVMVGDWELVAVSVAGSSVGVGAQAARVVNMAVTSNKAAKRRCCFMDDFLMG
jgi:hypothetical protein